MDSELFLYYHEYVGTTVILFYKPLAHIIKHCVSHLIHKRLQQCQKCHINLLALKKKDSKKTSASISGDLTIRFIFMLLYYGLYSIY